MIIAWYVACYMFYFNKVSAVFLIGMFMIFSVLLCGMLHLHDMIVTAYFKDDDEGKRNENKNNSVLSRRKT